MVNIMKSDIQRIFRGKGIYITLTVFIGMILISYPGELFIVDLGIQNTRMETDIIGVAVANHIMRQADNVCYIMIPVMTFIAAIDFSSGAVKNVLSKGISRSTYYLSKLFLASIATFLLYSLYVFIPIIRVTCMHGFGWTPEFMMNFTKSFFLQLLIMVSITSVGIFFVFTAKSSTALTGCQLVFLTLPTILTGMLYLIDTKFIKLFDYNLVMNMRELSNFTNHSFDDLIRIFLLAVGFMGVSTIGGIYLFKRGEIK